MVIHKIRRSNQRDFGLAFRLRGLVHSFQPDVVHAWDPDSVLLCSLALGRPGFGKSVAMPQFVASLMTVPRNKSLTRQIFERRIMLPQDEVFVPHAALEEYLIENETWPDIRPDNIHIAPNAARAVELDRDEARSEIFENLPIPRDATIAATVARLTPRTRLKEAIWSTRLITAFRDKVHVLIIGNGPQLWRLKRFAWQVGVQRHVHFLGHSQLAKDAFAGIDMLWHPYLWEPEPMSVLTAMASGIPVICAYGNGTRELILSQQTGMGVNLGAKDEFARWTKYFIERPESTAQLARQGREFVEQNYTIEKSIRAYDKVYGRHESAV